MSALAHFARSSLIQTQYTPFTGDLVIATVNGSAAENFNCLLTPPTPPPPPPPKKSLIGVDTSFPPFSVSTSSPHDHAT